MIKETGIIMSGDHPLKLMRGEKTQTRRVIKPQPWLGAEYAQLNKFGRWDFYGKEEGILKVMTGWVCPYGQVGDRLWVKETYWEQSGDLYYKADWGENKPVNMVFDGGKWGSPYFMPKWASRILLEITEIRVERLTEISLEDIKAEGIIPNYPCDEANYRILFQQLWDSLNGKKYPWASNPWVWVINFKLIK